MTKKEGSVGIAKTNFFDILNFEFESGDVLPIRLAYETYGELDEKASNAILICHSLTGNAHAAGHDKNNPKLTGWYDIAIGPGKTFDTDRYFVVCTNVLGGCSGSSGPSSTNPKTGKKYGVDFPNISIRDMVKADKLLLDYLGVKKLFCISGGSLGGARTLQFVIDYPDFVQTVIPIATAVKQYPMAIAFHEVGRGAILNDPDWKKGNYDKQPQNGLSLARQVAHITYLSQESLNQKFGRDRISDRLGSLDKSTKGPSKFDIEYEVQSYLQYKGKRFVNRFDANSYLYLTWALDNFDLTDGGKKRVKDVFKGIKSRFLVVSFSSDWLYPPEHNKELADGLAEAGVSVIYRELNIP
jgi:homoserine O-acetyltransferase